MDSDKVYNDEIRDLRLTAVRAERELVKVAPWRLFRRWRQARYARGLSKLLDRIDGEAG